MSPTEALARLAALCDEWEREARSTDGGLADGLGGCAGEVREVLEAVCPDIPPGRCGDPAPVPMLLCELLAGHAGMHQARQYPEGELSAGHLAYWTQEAGL